MSDKCHMLTMLEAVVRFLPFGKFVFRRLRRMVLSLVYSSLQLIMMLALNQCLKSTYGRKFWEVKYIYLEFCIRLYQAYFNSLILDASYWPKYFLGISYMKIFMQDKIFMNENTTFAVN